MTQDHPPTANVTFQDDLSLRLKDPAYAIEYLIACATEGDGVLLLGAKDIVRANQEKAEA